MMQERIPKKSKKKINMRTNNRVRHLARKIVRIMKTALLTKKSQYNRLRKIEEDLARKKTSKKQTKTTLI